MLQPCRKTLDLDQDPNRDPGKQSRLRAEECPAAAVPHHSIHSIYVGIENIHWIDHPCVPSVDDTEHQTDV